MSSWLNVDWRSWPTVVPSVAITTGELLRGSAMTNGRREEELRTKRISQNETPRRRATSQRDKLVCDSIVKGNRSVVISQFSQHEYAILESGKRPQQPFSLYLVFQLYEAWPAQAINSLCFQLDTFFFFFSYFCARYCRSLSRRAYVYLYIALSKFIRWVMSLLSRHGGILCRRCCAWIFINFHKVGEKKICKIIAI